LIFFVEKVLKKSEKSDDKKQIRNRGLMLENEPVARRLSRLQRARRLVWWQRAGGAPPPPHPPRISIAGSTRSGA